MECTFNVLYFADNILKDADSSDVALLVVRDPLRYGLAAFKIPYSVAENRQFRCLLSMRNLTVQDCLK